MKTSTAVSIMTREPLEDLSTPMTLDEAMTHIICIGPMSEFRERSYHTLRDFIAQKFGAAFLKAHDNQEALKIIEELFRELTKREVKK